MRVSVSERGVAVGEVVDVSCVLVWTNAHVRICHSYDRKKTLLTSKDKNKVLSLETINCIEMKVRLYPYIPTTVHTLRTGPGSCCPKGRTGNQKEPCLLQ